jgi:hypothetical protein
MHHQHQVVHRLPRIFFAVVVAAAAHAAARGAALHVDDFQSGTILGWAGGASPVLVNDGGPAGVGDKFLSISTPANGHLATFNDGTAWTGNLTSIGATQIKVDLMSPAASAPLPTRVVLFGPGSTAVRWTSTVAQTVPNDGVWRSYAFSLAEGDLTRVLGTATYPAMTADVVRVMLRFDPDTPSASGPLVPSPGGILNIDNVELAGAVVPPTPGDFNSDGKVDAADLDDPTVGWKARFGADLDGQAFLDWQRNLGAPAGSALAAPVPEPAACVVAVAGGAAALLGRRRATWRR